MTIVVDASAAVHLALRDILHRLAPHEAAAPALLRSETVATLRQLAWRGDIADQNALDALERIAIAPIRIETDRSLQSDAYDVARRLGWAKTYDAEYVALARRIDGPLLTTDARLARAAARVVGLVPLEAI